MVKFQYDSNRKIIFIGTKEIYLTYTENRLLEFLYKNKGCSGPYDILKYVWNARSENINSRIVPIYVHYLRKKVSDDIIITKNHGYELNHSLFV